ncbi:MAG: MIP/aquaporin family protein [Peptostreptococcaceae bacterium]
MSIFLAEFIGVAVLIFLGCGVLAGNSLKKSGTFGIGSLAINMVWACAVAMSMYVVGDISGAHLNPAITIAQALKGSFEWRLVPGYILAQMLGGMFGSLLVYIQFLPHWENTEDAVVKLKIFTTVPSIRNKFTNFISEYLVTFVLVFCILAIDKNSFINGLKPLAVGSLIFLLGTCFGGVTGAALNPARDFGPRLAHFLLPIPGKGSSDFRYGFIPIVAPIIGGCTGAMVNVALYDGIVDSRLYVMLFLTAIILFVLKTIEVRHNVLNKLSRVTE